MPLMPKRTKYRKLQRGNNAGLAHKNNKLDFGEFGLQTTERGQLTNNQIEAARVAINRHLKRRGKVWIKIFPWKSFTSRPLGVRMGKGKGNVEGYVAPVKPGSVLFEMTGCSLQIAREACALASQKLPIRCKFLARADASLTE